MTIKEKQNFLKWQGFYTGNIDGIWGKLSKKATILFQRSQHINADGIFGPISEQKANYLIKGNWHYGPVKFRYTRINGKIELCYVDENSLLSKNFRLNEFMMWASTIKAKKLNVNRNEIKLNETIVNACQNIRDHFNKQTKIESGYREYAYNRAIGGAKNSYHTKGEAADVSVIGVKPTVVQQYVREHYKELGIHGLESKTVPNRNQYTHIDMRRIEGLQEF